MLSCSISPNPPHISLNSWGESGSQSSCFGIHISMNLCVVGFTSRVHARRPQRQNRITEGRQQRDHGPPKDCFGKTTSFQLEATKRCSYTNETSNRGSNGRSTAIQSYLEGTPVPCQLGSRLVVKFCCVRCTAQIFCDSRGGSISVLSSY